MKATTAVVLAGLAAIAGLAYAADPPPPPARNFYAGAEIGAAAAHTTVPAGIAWQTNVDTSTTGWNLFAGFRPHKYFGAELAYLDFGSSKVDNVSDCCDVIYEARAKNHAIAGFVVGYVPLLPVYWDIFVKAGYARLTTETDSNGNYPDICVGNPCSIVGMSSMSTSNTTGNFAWGIGTQYRFDSLALRVEYQKITGNQAKPDMFSVGVAWNF